MRSVVMVSAVRTAIGKFGGALAGFTAVQLGAAAGAEALRRSGIDTTEVGQVIMSNARQAGVGPNPGRAVVPACGLPTSVPGATINMACGSGLKAVEMAFNAISLGEDNAVLVVGAEAMSQIPYLLSGARWGYRLGNDTVHDALHKDGFICALTHQHMGMTAENLAEKYGISRAESDEYAVLSQNRAEAGMKSGAFSTQIVPVEMPQKKGPPQYFTQDEHPRAGTTLESISRLQPVFKPDGIVTAASASGITDGAAAAVFVAEDYAQAHGLRALLRIRAIAGAGVEPSLMGIGPVPAARKALRKLGYGISDIDLIECNEAFAPQVIACERELGYNRDRANVNGGAIALGHPIGMTGVRLLVALAYSMPQHSAELGLATLCVNGGMGMAVIVENLQ